MADSAIGVTASGTNETVRYSTCFEPWIYAGAGPGSGTAGFDLYIDNGSGSASAELIAAAADKLNGFFSTPTSAVPGYRPAGVPYNVYAVVPIFADVTVNGTLFDTSISDNVKLSMISAVNAYFTLPFGAPAEQGQLAAVASNASLGNLSSFDLELYYQSAPGASVLAVSGAPWTRVILGSLTLNLG